MSKNWQAEDYHNLTSHMLKKCHYLANTMPLAHAKEFLGTAHLPSFEQAQQVNELIQTFLLGKI
jgi:pimeloyl-ACP methyl ester carboxylesterase